MYRVHIHYSKWYCGCTCSCIMTMCVCVCIMTVFVCFITKLMVCILIYSQYPLCPAHLSYDTSGVVDARVKPRQQKMEIDVAIPTHREHYSRSRGEQMVRAVDCASSEPCYKRYFSTTTISSSSYSSSHLLSSIAHPLSSSPPSDYLDMVCLAEASTER